MKSISLKVYKPFKTIAEAEEIVGGLSKPSKMPGFAYGIPASRCHTGAALHRVAGSVCESCYALKGRYSLAKVQVAQERRFQALTDPRWTDAMVFLLQKRGVVWFRWHDSGDLQGDWHLRQIVEVARRCPTTRFWLPTREKQLVANYLRSGDAIPSNLVVRLSAAMVDGLPPADWEHTSTVESRGYRASSKAENGAAQDRNGTCPAPEQGGKCQDCRACWDPTVKNVAYLRH